MERRRKKTSEQNKRAGSVKSNSLLTGPCIGFRVMESKKAVPQWQEACSPKNQIRCSWRNLKKVREDTYDSRSQKQTAAFLFPWSPLPRPSYLFPFSHAQRACTSNLLLSFALERRGEEGERRKRERDQGQCVRRNVSEGKKQPFQTSKEKTSQKKQKDSISHIPVSTNPSP